MNRRDKKYFNELMQKPWWNPAKIAAAVFLYLSGCSQLKTASKLSVPISVIFFGIIMHFTITDLIDNKLYKKNKNFKLSMLAKVIMYLILIILAALYYFNNFSIIYVLLGDLLSVVAYYIITVLSNKK